MINHSAMRIGLSQSSLNLTQMLYTDAFFTEVRWDKLLTVGWVRVFDKDKGCPLGPYLFIKRRQKLPVEACLGCAGPGGGRAKLSYGLAGVAWKVGLGHRA